MSSRNITRGGEIFATFCNPCHAGRVNPRGYHWSPGQMRRQIREGNSVMPGITSEFLTDAEVETVLAFLTMIGAVDGELPPLQPEGEVGTGLEAPPEPIGVASAP